VLSNLGSALHARFRQSAAEADLDEAIQVTQEAAASAYHPGRTAILANLAYALLSRFQRMDALADLDETIRIGPENGGQRPSS
jgi:hypothetical protein